MSATPNPDPMVDPLPDPSADPHQAQASPGIGRPSALALQATLVDFALAELVRQQRQSFQPLWSRESWAKLLIWLALNCGCGTDTASLRPLPPPSARARRPGCAASSSSGSSRTST